MATVVEFPQAATRVTEQALTWPERARAIVINSAESYAEAAELLLGIKDLRGEVNAAFDPIIQAQHHAHKTSIEQKRKAEAPLTEAESIIKRGLSAFDQERERVRRAEQARLEREAKERADAEALERAAAMEAEGRDYGDPALVEEAQQLIADQIAAPPPPVAAVERLTPKVAGITHKTTWSARVVNLIDLVKFVAANPSHIGLLQANQPALNAQARSLKGDMRLPGVQAVPTHDVAAGR